MRRKNGRVEATEYMDNTATTMFNKFSLVPREFVEYGKSLTAYDAFSSSISIANPFILNIRFQNICLLIFLLPPT